MDSRTFLIALLFGALAAGLAVIGFSAQEKYLAYRAEQTQVRSLDPEPAASSPLHFSLPQLREMSDQDRRTLLFVGLEVLLVGSYAWLLLSALKVGLGWGVAVFFGNYLAALVFLLCHPAKAAKPMLLHTLSWVLFLGYGFHILEFGLRTQ